MTNKDIVEKSPLRSLEQSLHGGLGKGNIGILASLKGLGKTACLVHIAVDKLFQEKPVIHVSYSSRVDYIITWYEDILKEITKDMDPDQAQEIRDEATKHLVVMNFKQEGTKTEQVLKSLEEMIEFGKFAADTIVVDGYHFTAEAAQDLEKFKDFAGRLGLEVWFSASLRGDGPHFDENGIPFLLKDGLEAIDVLITLHSKAHFVRLDAVKDREYPPAGELPIKLDPRTLLIAE